MSLVCLLSGIQRTGKELTADIGPGWMQGRTIYGGASTALALAAARRELPDLPQLRSAQIAFVAPLSGRIILEPKLLRSGSNSAFVEVDVRSESGLGLRGIFLFSRDRSSSVDHFEPIQADIDLTPDMTAPRERPARGDFFGDHFEYRPAYQSGKAISSHAARWVRARHHGEVAPELEMVALADALPPAVTSMMEQKIASSINWTFNIVSPVPVTRDGWWLLRSDAIVARHGFSSQVMTMWDRDLQMVATGMQSVAIFS